jgi:hypothetical protein
MAPSIRTMDWRPARQSNDLMEDVHAERGGRTVAPRDPVSDGGPRRDAEPPPDGGPNGSRTRDRRIATYLGAAALPQRGGVRH